MRREQGKPLRAVKWNVKRACATSLRAWLAVALLLLSLVACLNSESPTSTPTVVPTNTTEAVASPTPVFTPQPSPTAQPTPSPTSTPIPTPTLTPPPTTTPPDLPALTSGCTQDDVLSYSMPVSERSEPALDFNPHTPSIAVCGSREPKPTTSEDFLIHLALYHKYSYHFIEWAPDGKRLVINVPREGEIVGTGIYLVSADGSSSRLLVDASPEYNMLCRVSRGPLSRRLNACLLHL